jgi:hypothetical protein
MSAHHHVLELAISSFLTPTSPRILFNAAEERTPGASRRLSSGMGSATKSPLPTAAAALPPSVSDTSANDTSVGDRLGSPQVKMAQSPAPVRMASPQAAPVVEKVEERAAAPATPTAVQVQRHARDLSPLEWRAIF